VTICRMQDGYKIGFSWILFMADCAKTMAPRLVIPLPDKSRYTIGGGSGSAVAAVVDVVVVDDVDDDDDDAVDDVHKNGTL
jgi:hypothetical protein